MTDELKKDTSEDATTEHHRDLDATLETDIEEDVVEHNLDDAPEEDRPEEDDE